MVRMKVVDEHGESSMDEDQWEAASEHLDNQAHHSLTHPPDIYIAFAFEKR